jgi:hypothetical protein
MTAVAAPESAFEGRLEDVPLADIIQVLQVGAKTGGLLLRRPSGAGAQILFRGGSVIQATCTESYQSLGDRLVARGLVSKVDVKEGLHYLAQFPGMRLGDALVELGAVTRSTIEDEVKVQMAETIDRVTSWTDGEFEFRIGAASLPRGIPELALEPIHERGVEPRHLLLEASLLQDKRSQGFQTLPGVPRKELSGSAAPETPLAEIEEEAAKIVRWFDEGVAPPALDAEDSLGARTAASYLSISEELFVASGRGEIGLLLLRYAAELYSDGGLVLRTKEGFRVLGQFGEAFAWGEAKPAEPRTFFAPGESPLFDSIVSSRRPYVGFVGVSAAGSLAPAAPKTPGARVAVAIPLFVMGDVSLILFCRTALAGAPDARALIALARQVSVTLENAALREIARRGAPRAGTAEAAR